MKKYLKFIIIGVCMVALILGYYFYLSHRRSVDDIEETTTKVTQVQKLIGHNIATNYPPTPREVAKLYADITVAFYTEEYTDDELKALAMQLRELMDVELLDANPVGNYISSLKFEISSYKSQNIAFSSYSTSSATDVEYFKKDGRDCAKIHIYFTAKSAGETGLIDELFIMRKDNKGHWKIYGWKKIKNET